MVWWQGKTSAPSFFWGSGAITISAETGDDYLAVYLHQLPNGDPKLLRAFGVKLAAKLKEAFPGTKVSISWAPYIQLVLRRPNPWPASAIGPRPVIAYL